MFHLRTFMCNYIHRYCISKWPFLFITVDHTSLLLEMKSLNPKEKQDLDKQDSLEDQHRYI